MAEVLLKIVLNKGRQGIPLRKLAKYAKEIDKFLEMLSDDLHIEKPEWISEQFRNGSLGFNNRLRSNIPDEQSLVAQKALEQVTNNKTTLDRLDYGIRPQTFGQFARIVAPGDIDESVDIGVLTDKGTISRRILTKRRAENIEKQVKRKINKYCGYRGTISAFFPGSSKIHLSEKHTGKTINCIFKNDLYDKIIRVLHKQNALVNVEGWLRQDISEDSAYLHIDHLSELPEYKEGTIEKLFGCDPDFTGNLSTVEYLDKIRGRESDNDVIH